MDDQLKQTWIQEQLHLKSKCKFTDELVILEKWENGSLLIGGLDISFVKNSTSSVACLAVVGLKNASNKFTLKLEDHLCSTVNMNIPYVPNFLAFREVPAYQKVVNEFEASRPANLHPDIFMVDSNGSLHPRQVGCACHLGVLLDRPVFGVAKSLPELVPKTNGIPPDLSIVEQRKFMENRFKSLQTGDALELFDSEGHVYGAALLMPGSKKPVFVSPGHRVSLQTSIELTRLSCNYRVPEPTRMADIIGRQSCNLLEKTFSQNVRSGTDLLCDSA